MNEMERMVRAILQKIRETEPHESWELAKVREKLESGSTLDDLDPFELAVLFQLFEPHGDPMNPATHARFHLRIEGLLVPALDPEQEEYFGKVWLAAFLEYTRPREHRAVSVSDLGVLIGWDPVDFQVHITEEAQPRLPPEVWEALKGYWKRLLDKGAKPNSKQSQGGREDLFSLNFFSLN